MRHNEWVTIPAGTLVPRDARDFGNYQLLAKLATGGMAEIFLARPTGSAVEQDVLVLKRILPHLAEDEHFVTMFRDEADLASKLLHKNVCQVLSFGQFAGTWFIAMEYLHGVPLSRMMTRLSKAGKMLDARVVAGIIVQACDGLHSAHEARGPDGQLMGVVHRDVSPPNIMVCADGSVKLLDFGIAKARGANSRTRTGTVKGKNAYMSPEQILGKPLDRRSDVFALAVVMYEMLAIKRLFHRDSDFLTFKAITEEPIPDIRERRPDLPAALRAAIVQAMARDPNGRYDTAAAFAGAIRAALVPVGGPAPPADLARLLGADFAEEMSARDEILRAADDPTHAIVAGPTHISSPSLPVLRAPVPGPRSGELSQPPRRREGTGPLERVPSMMVGSPGTGRTPVQSPAPAAATAQTKTDQVEPLMRPPAPPTPPVRPTPPVAVIAAAALKSTDEIPVHHALVRTGPTALVAPARPVEPVPDLSATMPADSWMADPGTDILRAHRMRSVRNAVLAAAAIAAVVVGVVVALPLFNSSTAQDPPAVGPPLHAAVVDAGVAPVPADADTSHEQIAAFSRYGFYSIDANGPTTIFVDGKNIGETPLTKLPLKPGPHTVKALGPKGKTKEIKIVIYGGRDTDEEPIAW